MCRARYHIFILITLTLPTHISGYLSHNCETKEKKSNQKEEIIFSFLEIRNPLIVFFKNERTGHIVHLSKPLQGLPSFKAGFMSLYLLHGKHTSLTLY